eukprot:COSAG01_NODE_7751_length_3071_cov_7.706595_2_plen_47_part_00
MYVYVLPPFSAFGELGLRYSVYGRAVLLLAGEAGSTRKVANWIQID